MNENVLLTMNIDQMFSRWEESSDWEDSCSERVGYSHQDIPRGSAFNPIISAPHGLTFMDRRSSIATFIAVSALGNSPAYDQPIDVRSVGAEFEEMYETRDRLMEQVETLSRAYSVHVNSLNRMRSETARLRDEQKLLASAVSVDKISVWRDFAISVTLMVVLTLVTAGVLLLTGASSLAAGAFLALALAVGSSLLVFVYARKLFRNTISIALLYLAGFLLLFEIALICGRLVDRL